MFRAFLATGRLLAPLPHQCHIPPRCTSTLHSLQQQRRLRHVYTHGKGFLGCLGHGDFNERDTLHRVEGCSALDIRQISAGWTHSAAIDGQGRLIVWGRPYDFKGSMRLNNMQRVLPILVRAVNAFTNRGEVIPAPVIVPVRTAAEIAAEPWDGSPTSKTTQEDPPSKAAPATTLASSSVHAATTATQAVKANSDDGHGDSGTPVRGRDGSYPRAASVACSAALTAVLTEQGRVYCMGQNRWGQCGQGSTGAQGPMHVFEPLPVKGKGLSREKVVKLAVGFQHCLVLCESGVVYGWGKGERGQLGTGYDATEDTAVPVQLPGKAVDLSSGFNHAVALLENGDVYIWGKMQHPEVKTDGGVPLHHDQLLPRKMDIRGGVGIVQAFCSSFHTVLRAEDGTLFMCGLERDSRVMVNHPVEVDMTSIKPEAFFSGFNDTVLFSTSPTGDRLLDALSLTSEGAVRTPLRLPGWQNEDYRSVASVSVGWHHTMVLAR
ncbi:unnamed protein product [Sphacelaria rigidula]